MISEPALGADGEAPPSGKECRSGPHGPATLVEERREESRVPVHVVVPGHLHRPLARHRLDHRQRPGAGGAARLQQGAHDTLPRACFHVFDRGIKVGLQLAQMTAQVPHHAVRRDRIPVGPLNLDDDKHLLIAVHLNGQVNAPRPPRMSRH